MNEELEAALFIPDYYMDNPYRLKGTKYLYDDITRKWRATSKNPVHNIMITTGVSFQEVFDSVMSDENVSDDIKTKIIFHLDELKKL